MNSQTEEKKRLIAQWIHFMRQSCLTEHFAILEPQPQPELDSIFEWRAF